MELIPGYKQSQAGVIPETWQAKPILKALQIANGQVDPRVEPYKSMVLVAPDHIESQTGRLLTKQSAGEQRAISGKYLFDRGDVVYSKIRPNIVKSTAYVSHGVPVLTGNKAFILGYTTETDGVCTDVPAIVFDDFTTDSKFATVPFKVKSSAIKLLRRRDKRTSLRFVFERMQLIRFPVSEHKRYYISEFQNIRVPVPPYNEQLAVVSVLADMDAEIAALEARRHKTRDLKQTMMQELLTGKIRLVKPEAVRA